MKKAASKKAISLFTLLTILILATGASFAKEAEQHPEAISPRYTAIKSISSSLTVSETGKASCNAQASCYSSYTVDITAELQEDNGGWDTIKTWTNSGGIIASINKSYYVSTNYSHRLKATAYAYNSNGDLVETVIVYSDVT